MAQKRIEDLTSFTPGQGDLGETLVGVDRPNTNTSHKVTLQAVIDLVQLVVSSGLDPTGAADAGIILAVNNTNGNLFYVNDIGNYEPITVAGNNITQGSLLTATENRSADFGGFDLAFTNIGEFDVTTTTDVTFSTALVSVTAPLTDLRGTQPQLRLYDSANTSFTSLRGHATGTAQVFTLPSSAPASTEFMTVDAAGQLGTSAATGTSLTWVKSTSVLQSSTGGDATLTVADSTDPGLLTSADFDKLAQITVTQAVNLDTIESETNANTSARVPSGGADNAVLTKTSVNNFEFAWEVPGTVNLAYVASPTQGEVDISGGVGETGTSATVPVVGAVNAGLMVPADKTKLDALDTAAQVPAGGANDYILKKTSGNDYEMAWEAETGGSGLPAGGTVGEIVVNDAPGSGTWKDPASAGSGGEVEWAVPSGGSTGDVLKKSSATNYDYTWAPESGAGSTNLGWTASTSTVTNTGGTDAVLTVVDSTNPGLMTSADFDKLAFISATSAIDLDRVEELGLVGITAHGVVAGDVGKPVNIDETTDKPVVYDDTDYYAEPIGVVVAVDDANTFTIASSGDRVFIPYTAVEGGTGYDVDNNGRFMWWDSSANTGAGYWKAEPEADAAASARELITLIRNTGTDWEAVVL